ncbi:hypothetical protein McPS_01690 [Marichromatium sp. PS1]
MVSVRLADRAGKASPQGEGRCRRSPAVSCRGVGGTPGGPSPVRHQAGSSDPDLLLPNMTRLPRLHLHPSVGLVSRRASPGIPDAACTLGICYRSGVFIRCNPSDHA